MFTKLQRLVVHFADFYTDPNPEKLSFKNKYTPQSEA
jgi:hypothetical protein